MVAQVSKGQCQFVFAAWLWLWFVCGLLLLLLDFFRPGRHNAVHARVGNGLAEVFAEVRGDGDERTAERGRAVEHLLRFVSIGFAERNDSRAEMCEGILQGFQHLWLICRGRGNGLEIKARWWRRAECPRHAIVRGRNVREDFADRANAIGRTPGVLLSWHGRREPSVPLPIVADLLHEFSP